MTHALAQAAGLLTAIAGIGLATGNLFASVTAAGIALVVVSAALEAGK